MKPCKGNNSEDSIVDIKFSRVDNFNVRIDVDSPIYLNIIHSHCTAMYWDREFEMKWRGKGVPPIKSSVEVEKEKFYATMLDGYLLMKQGVARVLFQHIISNELITPSELNPTVCDKLNDIWFGHKYNLEFSDRWLEVYRTNPKGQERAELQLETAELIGSNAGGIIGLYTGAGKTELILGTLDAALRSTTGNVLIFTYAKAVGDEIKLRDGSYDDIIPKEFDINSRVNIVSPVGFVRRKMWKDPKIIEYFKNTDIIIGDEAHHWTAASWVTMTEVANPIMVYGFTATGDIEDGTSLVLNSVKFNSTPVKALDLVSCASPALIEADLPVPVNVFRVNTDILSKKEAMEHVNSSYISGMLNQFIAKPNTAKVIKKVHEDCFKEGITFIPIFTVESGIELCKNLNDLGLDAVFWSAEESYTPSGPANKALTLEVLKELARELHFKVLITTSIGVEGIDVPNLNSIIPITGKSFRQIIQGIGRSARADEVDCAFLFDTNCTVMNGQMMTKYNTVKTRLQMVNNTFVDLRTPEFSR